MHQLSDFRRLYARVTIVLQKHVADSFKNGKLSSDEATWFFALIQAFQSEFAKWQGTHPEIEIERYLSRLDARVAREVRLAGHAFLHIAYDLPTAMAAFLDPSVTGRTRQGNVFVQPGPLFSRVFIDFVTSGQLGFFRRLLPKDGMKIMSFWVLSLRTTAWIHAAILADTPSASERESLRLGMRQELEKACNKALSRQWITGISELTNTELVPAGIPLSLSVDSASLSAAALASAMVAGFVVRRHARRLAGTIEVLGALVNVAVQRGIRGENQENSNSENA